MEYTERWILIQPLLVKGSTVWHQSCFRKHNRKTQIMKTNLTHQNKTGGKNTNRAGYPPQRLSFSEAIAWFTLTVLALFLFGTAEAQTPIVQVNTSFTSSSNATSYQAKGASGSSFSNKNYTYTFGTATQAADHLKKLNSFTIGTEVYSYADNASSMVKIRRVNNNVVAGDRTLLWVEKAASASNTVAVVNQYNDNMESVFDGNNLNQGTDNLFANQGDGHGNNNNIERLDVIFSGGVISTINTRVGFALFERGDDNAHDPFVIAPITAIDINGNPTAYGNVLRVNTTDYGNLPSSSTDYYIVRKEGTESKLRMSTSGTQKIGGVFISFNDMGVAPGVKIYGYSIIAYDLPTNATGANLVDYTNSTYFPTNTSSATMQGGIDLIALTGVLSAPNSIILPPVADNIITDTLHNTALITAMEPFKASAASGAIAQYTVQTIPAANEGVLYLCSDGNCAPIVEGQVLTAAQINQLSFQPNPSYTGNVVFTYFAHDTYNQVSNVATYTIPVAGQNQVVLPVTILSFTGSIHKKSVQLNWQTSLEVNSSYFELQKSENGISFETFATATAKGHSSSISVYQATDDLFFYTKKQLYYRIKMVDTDGKYKYSSIINLTLDAAATTGNVKAWPVPFINQLQAEYNSEINQQITIHLVSMSGAVVSRHTAAVQQGRNVIAVSPAASTPSGTYTLVISSGTKTATIKVIKQ